MPKEIERGPYPLRKQLKHVRISFEELSELLARLDINQDEIQAASNGAEFRGLTDIKSAPARFSGAPFIQILNDANDEATASASVEFGPVTTEIGAGWYKAGSAHSSADDSLANTFYEELKPFESTFLRRLSWAKSKFATVVLVALAVLSLNTTIKSRELFAGGLLLLFVSGASFVCTWSLRDFFEQRPAVSFNPRETFWQRHGESSIVGISCSVLTALIVWLLLGS